MAEKVGRGRRPMEKKAPLSEREKYNAAWHYLRSAKQILPASGSVSVGPTLAKIEEAQEMVLERRDWLEDAE